MATNPILGIEFERNKPTLWRCMKVIHNVPQTGTLKLGGSLDCSFGKTGDEIKSWDENSANRNRGGKRRAPNWLSHLNYWFSHEFHCPVLDLHYMCMYVCMCLLHCHSYSLTLP